VWAIRTQPEDRKPRAETRVLAHTNGLLVGEGASHEFVAIAVRTLVKAPAFT